MLSVINQNEDTKLDVSLYYMKKVDCTKPYAICSLDAEHSVLYLAMYTKKKQQEEVFEDMIYWEENNKDKIYRMPDDEPLNYE